MAIVGDDVLIEPQTVWVFLGQRSHLNRPRKKINVFERAMLAASPPLHGSNVNAGLGATGLGAPPTAAQPMPTHLHLHQDSWCCSKGPGAVIDM